MQPIFQTRFDTPLGDMLAVASHDRLLMLDFTDRPQLQIHLKKLTCRLDGLLNVRQDPFLDKVIREVGNYFSHKPFDFSFPISLDGTDFQKEVWKTVHGIPLGEIRTYAQIAKEMGRDPAARAVGQANGKNPLAIIIPCHRVVGSDSSLHGYGGGMWRKKWLLDFESKGRNA